MKNQDLKYFLYARRSIEKSDKEERVASIESQISEMEEVAQKQGLKIVDRFYETKSAKKPYMRDEFQKMIEQIQKGKANGILCWKIDRLARNPVDEGTIKYLLQEGVIQNIKASDRDWYPDDNVLLASVEFGVATQYSRDLAKHIKRGLRQKAENGHRPAIAPLGYENTRQWGKGHEEILVDEVRFPLLRKVFDLALTGQHSVLELTKIANEEIGIRTKGYKVSRSDKKISRTNMYRILTNTFYYGEFEYPEKSGNWYQGKHKPMITKEEYDKIQFLLGRKDRPRSTPKHEFAYTGLIKCAHCGASITAEEKWKHQKNGNVHHYIYYRCTKRGKKECTSRPVRVEVIDKGVMDFLKKIKIPKDFHDWAITTLKEMHQEEAKDRDSILYDKQKQYKEVVKKLDRILEMRIAEEMTADQYSTKKSELESEQRTLKSYLDNIDQRISNWMEEVEKILDFSVKVCDTFKKADVKQKRQILASLGYNHFLKDEKLIVQAVNPILTVELMSNEVKLIHNKLEPHKKRSVDGQFGKSYAESPAMWRCRESNPGANRVRMKST